MSIKDVSLETQQQENAIREGLSQSLLTVLLNGTDMPCADLLQAIREGVSDGIYKAAMHGALSKTGID